LDRDIQKKLTTVCAKDRNIATQTSQSSTANCPATTRPATRRPTTMSARAGKKKLTKRAKVWRPEDPDNAGWANIVKASMTRRDEVWCYLITKDRIWDWKSSSIGHAELFCPGKWAG